MNSAGLMDGYFPEPLAFTFKGPFHLPGIAGCGVAANGFHLGTLTFQQSRADDDNRLPNLRVRDRFRRVMGDDFVERGIDWRHAGAHLLAWRENLLATKAGSWYADFNDNEPLGPLHWRCFPHHPLCSDYRHVLVPDNRITWSQGQALRHWFDEHLNENATLFGSTVGLSSDSDLTIFTLRWHAANIEPV